MTIASAITAAQGRVADCYTAISNKGGTLPATKNLANMPTAIGSITTGGTIDSLTVTPTTSQQTITATGGVDGYSPITVNAVTSSIDANISAGNIKSGVSILGVSGSVTELKGETRSVSLTSSSGNTFTPTSGKNGITSIKVTPNNQARSVTPSKSAQTLNVNSGYSGNGTISVSAVTSSIDSNITAGNIKKNVQILGVTGTYEGSGSATLITKSITHNGTYNASSDNADGYSSVTVNVSGGGGSVSRLFTANYWVDTSGNVHNIEDDDGNTISAEATSIPSTMFIDYESVDNIKYLDCSNLVSISGTINFGHCENLEGLDFSNLETAGDQAFYSAIFGNPKLTQIVFPKLTSAGYRCFYLSKGALLENEGMSITARFPSLSNLNADQIFYQAFGGYQSVIIYFNALTTSSFGSNINQFQQIVRYTEEAEIHFPSNMQSTISGLTGYPTFDGEDTTLVFDLPATS